MHLSISFPFMLDSIVNKKNCGTLPDCLNWRTIRIESAYQRTMLKGILLLYKSRDTYPDLWTMLEYYMWAMYTRQHLLLRLIVIPINKLTESQLSDDLYIDTNLPNGIYAALCTETTIKIQTVRMALQLLQAINLQ